MSMYDVLNAFLCSIRPEWNFNSNLNRRTHRNCSPDFQHPRSSNPTPATGSLTLIMMSHRDSKGPSTLVTQQQYGHHYTKHLRSLLRHLQTLPTTQTPSPPPRLASSRSLPPHNPHTHSPSPNHPSATTAYTRSNVPSPSHPSYQPAPS